MEAYRPAGMRGPTPTSSWVDEVLWGRKEKEPEHRWWDHFLAHDDNAENHWLFGSDQKTLEVWWCWLWCSFEFGAGMDFERPLVPTTPWFSAWVNIGFFSLGVSLKRRRWREK